MTVLSLMATSTALALTATLYPSPIAREGWPTTCTAPRLEGVFCADDYASTVELMRDVATAGGFLKIEFSPRNYR